jgi:hypothetical protein
MRGWILTSVGAAAGFWAMFVRHFVFRFLKTLQPSVQLIDVHAFSDCPSLTDIVFDSGSRLLKVCGFVRCTSLSRIVIPLAIEIVTYTAFFDCTGLTEVIFEAESHLKEFDGFGRCTSLCRIVLPPSIECIDSRGFSGCISLAEVVFESESHLTDIQGFARCTALGRISFPPSLQFVNECLSLHVVDFPEGSQLCDHRGLHHCKCFMNYPTEHLKAKRRSCSYTFCDTLEEEEE